MVVSVNIFYCVPLLLFGLSQVSHAGNVLVVPAEYSHWLNMRVMVEELVERNHSVTVLIADSSPSIKYNKPERFAFKVFQVPHSKEDISAVIDELIKYSIYGYQNDSILQTGLKVWDIMGRVHVFQKLQCDAMLKNEALLNSLREMKLDVVLADPVSVCGDLVADVLKVPLVISLRLTYGFALERHCGHLPTPPSFVPSAPSLYTDHMTFFERVMNMIYLILSSAATQIHTRLNFDPYYSEIKGMPTTVCDIMRKAEIWLIRTYWDLEYPQPFLPNFQFVGGLHCKPAQPLPADMEEFVQSSGDDGIVVLSLGSMIKNLTKERANTIATALGQIPQKVIWRLSGEKPDTFAPNTRVYDWIPQNDLLGHPKTKAFISHCGTNGLYEAIYHGVPIVGVPLFGDQVDNISHMKNKGAAVMLDFYKMNSQVLVDGLNAVINYPSYKESMMKLSNIHHDQPMTPLETAVFWIEFVMRNKGAKHLRVASHQLNWFQYHSLDVVAALLSIGLIIAVVFMKSCCFCMRKCCGKTSPRVKMD